MEEAQEELNQLSVEEHTVLELDMKGFAPLPMKRKSDYEEACLEQMAVAVSRIPDHEKQEYLRAVDVCLDLVRIESVSLRFLIRTNFEVDAAARRLVLYWHYRSRLFGDRAYLPLTMSGDGALTADDVDMLRTGSVMLLPSDNTGRPIVYFQSSLYRNMDLVASASTVRRFVAATVSDASGTPHTDHSLGWLSSSRKLL